MTDQSHAVGARLRTNCVGLSPSRHHRTPPTIQVASSVRAALVPRPKSCNVAYASRHVAPPVFTDVGREQQKKYAPTNVNMSDKYTLPRPVKRVAIIGAGPGGVPAARQLRDHGLDVTLFERQDRVGGVWNWREDSVGPQSIPTPPPSRGAFTPDSETEGVFEDGNKQRRYKFNPPNPCYWNLTNNVPTKTMEFKDFPYPPGTPDNVPHYQFAKYVHDYWKHFGLESLTTLNTRVEKAEKKEDGAWELRLRQQETTGNGDQVIESTWTDHFDAVLVATGHYNAPLIPDTPGSSGWYKQFPGSILHSQGYRRPETYAGQTVLIIGAGTSGMDIAKDLSEHAAKVLIAARVNHGAPETYRQFRQFQVARLPPRSERIAEVARFRPVAPGQSIREGEIELADGSVISGVDTVIWCTGYQYSYPFLSHLHHDPGSSASPPPEDALVTAGDQVLNLYRDVFYIPDPTLTFIGLSVNTSAFSFFEYQSISVARVWSQQARLPTQEAQREALAAVVASKGDGKFRHFMGKDGEREYVRETVEWINRDAKDTGATEVEGHSEQWLWESDQTLVKIAARYGVDPADLKNLGGSTVDPPAPAPVQEAFAGVKEERLDLNSLAKAVAVV